MDANLEFLNYIYQNAQMGVESLEDLIPLLTDRPFKEMLEKQHGYYKETCEQAGYLMAEIHEIPKEVGQIQSARTHMMIRAKTLTDKTPSHLAEMLIQGTVMGIIQLRKSLNRYTENEVDKKTLELGRKLMTYEEAHVEELKKYL